jgi:hypothetical protein
LFETSVALAIVACVGCSPVSDSFSISTKHADDVATIESIRNRLVISIRSPRGISSATLERKAANWPDTIELRLYLKGLENFVVSSGKNVLEASYSSSNHELTQRKDGNELEALELSSDYWMNVEILDADKKIVSRPAPPEGYFAIKLPKRFLEEAKQTIVLDWIDFYR